MKHISSAFEIRAWEEGKKEEAEREKPQVLRLSNREDGPGGPISRLVDTVR